MEPMTGVVASRANDRLAGLHRKGGGANDRCGYHFDIYRNNRLADCLWQLCYSVACLSRQRQG